ncbi:unnamed protein product, partial [Mesorhabditis spiculigera]
MKPPRIYPSLASDSDAPDSGMTGRELAEKLPECHRALGINEAQAEACQKVAEKNDAVVFYMDDVQNMAALPQAQPTRKRAVLQAMALAVTTPKQANEIDSYLHQYNFCPPPVFILLVTAIQIGVFFYYYWTQPHSQSISTYCAGCYVNHHVGPMMFVPKMRAQAWRFLTYMFLHAGIMHLVSNLTIQLIIGIPLELVHKIWRIGPLYLLAVVSGALLQYAMDPSVMLVGASAGVYALIMAHISNLALNWSEMPFRWIRLLVLAVWVSFDVGGTIYRRFYEDPCDRVSHVAHIAGAITGLFCGFFILYNVVPEKWEQIGRWISFGVYTFFFIAAIAFAVMRQPTDSPIWSTTGCDSDL